MFFVRFTTNANKDLERGQSFHATDFAKGEIKKSRLAEMMGCEKDDIKIIDKRFVQMLDGLCGFELEAETLEEAIEEVEDSLNIHNSPFHQYSSIGGFAIFKGKLSSSDFQVPDGDLFIPFSVEFSKAI